MPNFYPVATDPTLIYLVLRNPPDGASSATFHAGTAIDFGISIDSMTTFDRKQLAEETYSVEDISTVQGFGFAVEQPFMGTRDTGGAKNDYSRTIKTNRGSTSHYEYAITFDYDISTSTNPATAGRPSDVIVGGGIDIILPEAIEGM